MATERLYWSDPYMRQFDARVVEVTDLDGRKAVVLDSTAFYPEGGGQPADRGALNGHAIADVQERDGVIYHILEDTDSAHALRVASGIRGEVDWARRFTHMQQHTGQHILSGGFWRLCGAETLSWHLGDTYTTVDLALPHPSPDLIAEVEEACNAVVWEDIPVSARIYQPNESELEHLSLRRGPKVDDNIRIVKIGDWDAIGCGGTHVRATGGVGSISVRRWESRSRATRIEFVCGGRALHDHRRKTRTVASLIQLLTAPETGLETAVAQLQQQNASLQHETQDMRNQLLAAEADRLLQGSSVAFSGHPLVCASFSKRDAAELRYMGKRIGECAGIALLGCTSPDESKANLVFACDGGIDTDLNKILREVLPLLDGRGGGQRHSAQGGGPKIEGLQPALNRAVQLLQDNDTGKYMRWGRD